jgi:hypothetical protein
MSLHRLASKEFGVSKEVVWYAIFKAIYKSGPWLKVRSSDGSDILFASKKVGDSTGHSFFQTAEPMRFHLDFLCWRVLPNNVC